MLKKLGYQIIINKKVFVILKEILILIKTNGKKERKWNATLQTEFSILKQAFVVLEDALNYKSKIWEQKAHKLKWNNFIKLREEIKS